MNVSSRCWSPFHTNECVFSRNEQQKVYYILYQFHKMLLYVIIILFFCPVNRFIVLSLEYISLKFLFLFLCVHVCVCVFKFLKGE